MVKLGFASPDQMLGLLKPQISSASEPGPEASKYHSLLKGTGSLEKWIISRAAAGKVKDPRISCGRKQESAQKMIGTREKDNRSQLGVSQFSIGHI